MRVEKIAGLKILIVGGYSKARSLALSLLEKGCRVTAINRDRNDAENLAEIKGLEVILGDGTKKYVLEDANSGDKDMAFILTDSDEDNLIISEMCKDFFGVKKTICLLKDPSKTSFFYSMGVDRVVCPMNIVTTLMEEEAIFSEMSRMVSTDEGRIAMAEIPLLRGSELVGKKLWELNLNKDIIIGCILRGDQNLIPRGDTTLKEGDVMITISSDREKLVKFKTRAGHEAYQE